MTKPLTPQTVYFPVKCSDELPEDKVKANFVIYGNNDSKGTLHVEYFKKWNTKSWLKPLSDQFLFSREQLVELLGDSRREIKESLLKQLAQMFLNPCNQDKADLETDKHVIQALGEKLQSFPFQETEYIKSILP